jgi:hypothetical protein
VSHGPIVRTENTREEIRAALDRLDAMIGQQRAAVQLARPALKRLVDVMRHKTGQGYKLRALLFSLWNGKPTTLSDVCGLDHKLRQDLCDVILAWGYGRGDWEFFYNAMKTDVSNAGLWEWFLESGEGRCGECGRGQ